jgi:hypothetical protein
MENSGIHYHIKTKTMKKILHNWNLSRIIRLAAGAAMIIYSLQTQQWLFAILGGLLLLTALLNARTCAEGNCRVPKD